MYVLPFSKTEALVEYTLFSAQLLPENEYDEAIAQYLKIKFGCSEFEIGAKEKGSIPMTCYDFEARNSENIVHIGTAGGWAKPSTGYTFRNTYRNTDALVLHLKNKGELNSFSTKNRFRFYDCLLLDILHNNNEKGQYIFETLFEKRPPELIFKFLDEETSRWEDIKIISGCPKKEFIWAFLHRLW
jgi:lycopene beta-cyclase